jgi:DNA-binding NarL/FixJ family response regulator
MPMSMLCLKEIEMDAVLKFLQSQTLGNARGSATLVGVLLLLPGEEQTTAKSDVYRGMGLTERECSVLKGVAEGRSNAEIAGDLNTTVGSVKGTVQSLFRKLAVPANRRSALVRAAIEAGRREESEPELADPCAGLTQVESTVLDAVRKGWTNRQIADHLQMAGIAVKATIRGICTKLGAWNRRQLAARADGMKRSSIATNAHE